MHGEKLLCGLFVTGTKVLQEELIRTRAEVLEKDVAWNSERELLLQQQAPPHTNPQPIVAPASGDSGAEAKLREQLRRQDKMVRALRDVIKQLGVSSSPNFLHHCSHF